MIRRILARLRGIRARLALIISLVAVLATVGATGVNYVTARRTVLAATQDQVMTRLRDAVDAAAPAITMPPDQDTLTDLARSLPGVAVARYGKLSAGPADYVPAELADRVRAEQRLVFQRVDYSGIPALVVGMPVLTAEQQQISEFALNGWRTAAVAVALAVVLAWLAAGAVLRPVRRLRDGARQLAHGRLSTRLPERGGDELAELARTFNESAANLEKSVGELRRMEADARRFVADVCRTSCAPRSPR